MAGELVSVVVPTCNYGRYISEAVASVLAQRYPHVEVVVVDDGSTDDTPHRLEPYRDRITCIRQENQGVSAARNTGIRAARGEVIALLDADDVWHPRKLELQMRCLAEHPEIGLLGTDLFADSRDCWPAVADPPCLDILPLRLDDLVYRTCFAPSSVLVRRRRLDAVGLFDPGLRCAEDRDLWVRIAGRFPVAKLPLRLMWYRTHPLSLSANPARSEQNERRMLHRAFATLPALRRRPLLRLKTLSHASFNAASLYGARRRWLSALGRLARSLLLWPWPYRRQDADGRLCPRMRMAAVLLLRMLGLFPLDPGPAGGTAPPAREAVVPTC
jgi:glycosyltransferase involved in cell wall biosynthesis